MAALEGTEMLLYGAIEKIATEDDGTIKVYGVASSESRDNDHELIKAEAIRGAIPDYMQFPAIREMHQLSAAGKALEIAVGDDGITRIVAHIVDPGAIVKVKNQVYNGFSVGGRALERDPHDRKIITKMSMHEISLVDRPCNPDAVFDLWKADNPGYEGGAEAGAAAMSATFSEPTNPASGLNSYDLEGQKPKPKTVAKRNFSQKERDAAAASGAAMSDGSFPIENQEDLDNAVGLRGNSKHSKGAVEAHIRSRAKTLGLKVPDMSDDTKKADGPTMGDLLKAADGTLTMGDLVEKVAAEATAPEGTTSAVTDSEHSENDTSGRAARVGTEAPKVDGSDSSVNPAAPALQSTNQKFGAGVSNAATGALADADVDGASSVPAHGAGAAGEGLTKGMGSISRLADMLCCVKWLLVDQRWEEAMENEKSELIGQMEAWLRSGATLLGSVVSHEVQELLAEAMVDPGDAMSSVALVAKTIQRMQGELVAKAGKPVDADTGGKHEMDPEDSDEGKVTKAAMGGPTRHPDDLAKIASLEARLKELESEPVDKSIAGPATAVLVSKAQDTVSGFAEASEDDQALLKAMSEMKLEDRQAMVFKALLSRPTRVIAPTA